MFVPDKDKKVTCFSACAKIWPPLFVSEGSKAVAGGSAKQALIGSDPDKAGGTVVTYKHWPLYLYLGDTKPGVGIRAGAQPERRPVVCDVAVRSDHQAQAAKRWRWRWRWFDHHHDHDHDHDHYHDRADAVHRRGQ